MFQYVQNLKIKSFQRYFLFMPILNVLLWSSTLCAQTLSEKIDTIIHQKLPHAIVGVVIKDLTTGQMIYSKNADKLMSPASTHKLFTATAAFYQLHPTYRFFTTLSQQGQNFYLIFSGAPDLTTDNLNELLGHLKKSGGNVIQGNIILDISRFSPPYYSGGVSYDDLGWYYSAPETALILNENAVSYDFISAKKIGEAVQVKPKTFEKKLKIINELVTVSQEQAQKHCHLNIEIQPNNTLRLFGCLAQTDHPVTMEFAVPDPVFFAKQEIKHFLKQNNISLKGQILLGQAPKNTQFIASLASSDLTQLITHMLQESDNLYANSLTRTLGQTMTGEGSTKQGAFAVRQILSKHSHLDMTQLEIADGMGTRYNLATPEQIVILLTEIYQNKIMRNIFLNALPQAGVSGSLKNRMKQTNLDSIVFAKTGTMHDISSLSGYLLNPKAHPKAFSIIINGINTPISTAKSLEEEILDVINHSDMKRTNI